MCKLLHSMLGQFFALSKFQSVTHSLAKTSKVFKKVLITYGIEDDANKQESDNQLKQNRNVKISQNRHDTGINIIKSISRRIQHQ